MLAAWQRFAWQRTADGEEAARKELRQRVICRAELGETARSVVVLGVVAWRMLLETVIAEEAASMVTRVLEEEEEKVQWSSQMDLLLVTLSTVLCEESGPENEMPCTMTLDAPVIKTVPWIFTSKYRPLIVVVDGMVRGPWRVMVILLENTT